MIVQIFRRCVQAAVLLLVAAIATLSLYAHYRAARVIDDEQLMKGMRGEVMATLIHPYIDKLENPQALLDANKGTVWSMRLGGIELTDPLAAAAAIAASKHIHWPLLVSIVIPVILTLLLGKVFCSWICPGYLLFELSGKLRRLLRFAEIPPAEVRFSFANKYIVLIVGLAVAAVTSAPLFALIYPPAVISRVIHAWVFGTALSGMLVLLGVMTAIELFISPRWWCRTMCPGGALYGLLGAARPLRVKLKTDKCTACKECIPVCEAGIDPITQSQSIECDNCGVCIRHCPEKALSYGIALPGSMRRAASRTTAVAMGTLLFSPLFVTPAYGHHILGLPHYSYKENYPQRPTLEYPAMSGPYDILLTSYPGKPLPGEPANLAFYIKNRETHAVYDTPILVRVLQTSTFGDNRGIVDPTERHLFDNQYKLQVQFPTDGEYIVELSMMVEGRTEVIPFLMIVGEPTATASIIVAGAFGLVLTLVIVRAVQKKRKRKRSQGVARTRQAGSAGDGESARLAESAEGI